MTNPNTRNLISGLRTRAEREVNDLRVYEDPPLVKVYDLQGNFLRTEEPTIYVSPSFNGRKKGSK